MRLYKRGQTYYGAFYQDGVRIQRSTRCKDRKAAETAVRRWERDAADPANAAARSTTLRDALQLLLNTRQQEATAGRRSQGTVDFYRIKAGHFIRAFGEGFLLHRLDPGQIDGYVAQRRKEEASESTISKELITLRGALKLARRQKLWRGDPAEILPIAFAPEYKPRRRFLSLPELQSLLSELTPDKAARVAFTVASAATWSDTDRAQRSDISEGLNQVWVRGVKTSYRSRIVPLVTTWQRALMGYALEFAEGVDGAMFWPWFSVRRDLHEACARAKIPPCSPNDLRRTTATWLRAAGVPSDLVAAVLGHADSRMVERVYGKLPLEILRARLEQSLGVDCNAGGTASVDSAGFNAPPGLPSGIPALVDSLVSVPRGGIEPPTRGFSGLKP
jgi:integrase